MASELAGQVALVTGSGRGIGAQIARALGACGARVAVHALHPESAEAGRAALAAAGVEAIAVPGDVSDPAQAGPLVGAVVERFGRLDILVNNAGILRRAPSLAVTPAQWGEVLATNLTGPYFIAQAAARAMVATGGGQILNISSIWASLGGDGRAAYSAAKAGLEAVTRVLAGEWAPLGIRVNAVAPGHVLTEQVEELVRIGRLNLDAVVERTPAAQLATALEVGEFCARLLAGQHARLTGVVIPLDGGLTRWAGRI